MGVDDAVCPNRKSVQYHNFDRNLDLFKREFLFFNVNKFMGPLMVLAPVLVAARSKA